MNDNPFEKPFAKMYWAIEYRKRKLRLKGNMPSQSAERKNQRITQGRVGTVEIGNTLESNTAMDIAFPIGIQAILNI
jgi:hypothetical protein